MAAFEALSAARTAAFAANFFFAAEASSLLLSSLKRLAFSASISALLCARSALPPPCVARTDFTTGLTTAFMIFSSNSFLSNFSISALTFEMVSERFALANSVASFVTILNSLLFFVIDGFFLATFAVGTVSATCVFAICGGDTYFPSSSLFSSYSSAAAKTNFSMASPTAPSSFVAFVVNVATFFTLSFAFATATLVPAIFSKSKSFSASPMANTFSISTFKILSHARFTAAPFEAPFGKNSNIPSTATVISTS